MSAHHKKELPADEKVKIGKLGGKVVLGGLGIGVPALALCVILGLTSGDSMRRWFHSYLLGITYFTSFAAGAMFFVIIHHLVKAKWSITTRRIAELLTRAFPLLGLLTLAGILLPVLLGNESFYVWTAHSPEQWAKLGQPEAWYHHVHHKSGYLNPLFFSVRVLIYFGIFTGLSQFFFKNSVKHDESADPKLIDKMRKVSGPAIILYAFTTALFGFDMLMTLMPTWYSTMFGVYFWAGCAISIYALLSLVTRGLQGAGKIKTAVTVEHYHDLGKMLFAMIFFWGYVSFSQFMLIWYADIPEETSWFWKRMFTNWEYLGWTMVFLHFAFPFVSLLSRWTKRKLHLLTTFAAYMLFMHLLDLYWIIMPEYYAKGYELSGKALAMDITAVLGIGGLFFAAVGMSAKKTNLIPVKDPDLGDSLAHENF
jgi:hypothetical protein